MNNKTLAEMVKRLRKKKLEEIIGKPGKFNPAHHSATHSEDPESPNQYAHKVSEAIVPIFTGGDQGKSNLGNLKDRFAGQRGRGRQNQTGRNLNQMREQDNITSNVDLGSTDTGKKGKESEVINVNPNIDSIKDQTTKNTIKEIKEK
jgi:hypothetical protein